MGKQYQTTDVQASMPGLTMPEQVSVALAEIAESATEGLLALAVGAGLQVLGTLMEESVTALAGPRASRTRTGPRSATATSGAR
jgi:putative transposase